MNIQIKSDLHLDASKEQGRMRWNGVDKNDDIYFSPKADVLILAGDTFEDKPQHFSEQFEAETRPIIMIAGNHEYCRGDVDETPAKLKKYFRDTNVRFLHRDAFALGDILYIGATLWTPLTGPEQYDYGEDLLRWHRCEGMDVDWWQKEFIKDFHFIKSMLESPQFADYKKVVITHFLPSFKSVPERFKDHPLNICFVADPCVELMHSDNAPAIWIHGHTHDSMDYQEGNSRVICNPYGGYGRDINPRFERELVVTL